MLAPNKEPIKLYTNDGNHPMTGISANESIPEGIGGIIIPMIRQSMRMSGASKGCLSVNEVISF